jgi:glyoxalase-like protein
MNSAIYDIDHLMVSAQNGARAQDNFSRLGFTLTPRGQLPGLCNRLICFAGQGEKTPNFVEFMTLEDADIAPPAMAQALKGPDRPVLMVAATKDAALTKEQLASAGIETSSVIDGERDWTLDDGTVLDLAFSIVLPSGGQAPYYWIACQHKTPQHYLRPDFTRHANGSTRLSHVIAVAQNPSEVAKHFVTHWGSKAVKPEAPDAPIRVTRGDVELHIFSREGFLARFPGISLERENDHIVGFAVSVPSLEKLAEHLKDAEVPVQKSPGAVFVPPSEACGTLVVFEEQHG